MNKKNINITFENHVHCDISKTFRVSAFSDENSTIALIKRHSWEKNGDRVNTLDQRQQQRQQKEQRQRQQELKHSSSARMSNHHFPEIKATDSTQEKCGNDYSIRQNNDFECNDFVCSKSKSWNYDITTSSENRKNNSGDNVDHNNSTNGSSLRRLAWRTNNVCNNKHHTVNSYKSYISLPLSSEISDDEELVSNYHEDSVKTCFEERWKNRRFNERFNNRTSEKETLEFNKHNKEWSNNGNRFRTSVSEIGEDNSINVKCNSKCAEHLIEDTEDRQLLGHSCRQRSLHNKVSCCEYVNHHHYNEEKEECRDGLFPPRNCTDCNNYIENDTLNNLQESSSHKNRPEYYINDSRINCIINNVNNIEEEWFYCENVDTVNENNSVTTHAQHKQIMNTWLDDVQNVNKHRVKVNYSENKQKDVYEVQCIGNKQEEIYSCENNCENTDSVCSSRFNVARTQLPLSHNPDTIHSRARGHERYVHSQGDDSELEEISTFLLQGDACSVTDRSKHYTVNNDHKMSEIQHRSNPPKKHGIQRETFFDTESNLDVVKVNNNSSKSCTIIDDNNGDEINYINNAENKNSCTENNYNNAESAYKKLDNNKSLHRHNSEYSNTNNNSLGDDYCYVNDHVGNDHLSCNSNDSDDISSKSNNSNSNSNFIKMLNSVTLLIHAHNNFLDHGKHKDSNLKPKATHRIKTNFVFNNSKKCDDNNNDSNNNNDNDNDGDDDVSKSLSVEYNNAADCSSIENIEHDGESTIESAVEEMERNLVFLPYQNECQEIEERSST